MGERRTQGNQPEHGGQPAWNRIAVQLRSELSEAGVAAHQRFSSEAELRDRFGVSRVTVRRAISELVREGRLYTRPGLGTFVAPSPIQARLGAVTGFSEKMRSLGFTVTTRVLSAAVQPLDKARARELEVESGTPSLLVRRVRLVEGTPVAIQVSCIAPSLVPPLLDQDFTGSLTELLRDHCGVAIATASERVSAGLVHAHESSVLDVASGSPVLRLASTSRTGDGTPVRLSESTYRGDVICFTFQSIHDVGPQLDFAVAGSNPLAGVTRES